MADKKNTLKKINAKSSSYELIKKWELPLTILSWFGVAVALFWVLGHIGHLIILLLMAGLLTFVLKPIVDKMEKYLPRSLAILFIYILIIIILASFLYLIVSKATGQIISFAQSVNHLISVKNSGESSPLTTILVKLGASKKQIAEIVAQLTALAQNLVKSLVPFLNNLFTMGYDIFMIAIISIYFLIDGPRIVNIFKRNIPLAHKNRIFFVLETLERVVGGYIRGQITLAAIIGLLIGVGMKLFNVPYAYFLGLMAFFLEFIPMIGTIISGAICVLLALTQGWLTAGLVLVYFVIMHLIEADILGPKIVGKKVGLHPLVSLIALIAGSELYGILGALFAAPTVGVLQVVLVTLWLEWKKAHPEAFAND